MSRKQPVNLTDLPRPVRELTLAETEAVQGGISDPNERKISDPDERPGVGVLPYIEQGNLYGRK